MIKKHITATDIILCGILALAFTAAPYYLKTGDCSYSVSYFLSAAVMMMVLLLLTGIIRYFLASSPFVQRDDISSKGLKILKRILQHKHPIIITGTIIFICWLPTLLCLYPGTLINDTWGQLRQYIQFTSGTANLFDHHPIFDTLIMGVTIVPLAKATGQWHLAFFIYVILQSFLTSLAFAYVISYLYHSLKLNLRIIAILLLVYCIFPLYPASTQTISKDSLSAWIFVLFVTDFAEIVRTKGTACEKGIFVLRFLAMGLLTCLTKKVGMFIVIPSLVCLVIFCQRFRVKLVVCFCCILLMNVAVMPLVRNALNVEPGGKQEMFSLPFQMSARYVTEHREDITENEYTVLDKVLRMSDLTERYNPTSADPVKEYQQKGEDRDYLDYVKVWLKQGLRHPGTYIKATDAMMAGWFSWEKYDPLMDMDWHNQLNIDTIPEEVSQRTFNKQAVEEYKKLYDNLYESPFLRILLSYGLYASVIPAFALGTVIKRRSKEGIKYWIAIVPILLALVLGCWLAPVSVHLEGKRYLYPLTYTAPLVLGWCVYIYRDSFEISGKKG